MAAPECSNLPNTLPIPAPFAAAALEIREKCGAPRPATAQSLLKVSPDSALLASGELRMKHRKTTERNREIFLEFRSGRSPCELAANYGLSRASIVAIVCVEKHRLEVSEDAFYRKLRASLGIQSHLASTAAE